MGASLAESSEPLTLEARSSASSVDPVASAVAFAAEPTPHEGTARKSAAASVAGPARIDALTGLRFLLALAVVLCHVGPPPVGGPWLQSFFRSGYAGVTLFFVLSGFVLTHNYFDRFASRLDCRRIWSFLVARIARVYPLYLFLLVWVAFPALCRGDARLSLFFEHALGLQAWEATTDRAYAFNGAAWSVSVEIFLYCCFPVLMVALAPVLRSRRRIVVTAAVVTLVLAAVVVCFQCSIYSQLGWRDPRSSYRWLYRWPLSRLGDFVLGILGARLLAKGGSLPRRQAAWLVAISAAAMVALMSWPTHFFTTPSWDISYAVPGAILIYGLAASPLPAATRWLSSPSMLLLGESSYALYLCHRELLPKLTPSDIPRGAWFFENALVVLLVIALAVGLHVWIERPARVRVRRWLEAAPARVADAERIEGRVDASRPRLPTVAAAFALAALTPLGVLAFRLVNGQSRDVVTFDELIGEAALLIDRKQPGASLAVLAQAERMKPERFPVFLNRCVAYGLLEQRDEAVSACRRAVELEPQNLRARSNLAWVEGLARAGARDTTVQK